MGFRSLSVRGVRGRRRRVCPRQEDVSIASFDRKASRGPGGRESSIELPSVASCIRAGVV